MNGWIPPVIKKSKSVHWASVLNATPVSMLHYCLNVQFADWTQTMLVLNRCQCTKESNMERCSYCGVLLDEFGYCLICDDVDENYPFDDETNYYTNFVQPCTVDDLLPE